MHRTKGWRYPTEAGNRLWRHHRGFIQTNEVSFLILRISRVSILMKRSAIEPIGAVDIRWKIIDVSSGENETFGSISRIRSAFLFRYCSLLFVVLKLRIN